MNKQFHKAMIALQGGPIFMPMSEIKQIARTDREVRKALMDSRRKKQRAARANSLHSWMRPNKRNKYILSGPECNVAQPCDVLWGAA